MTPELERLASEAAAPDPGPDLSTWVTKEQTAAALGVVPKTVERMAQRGQIQQALWKRPGQPLLAVYAPEDVARLAKDRGPGPLPPFVLPAASGHGNGNGNGHGNGQTGLETVPAAAPEDLLRVLALVSGLSQTSQTPIPLFLTLEQAAAYSGLTETYLRRQITAGALEAVKDRGWRVRRADLDGL